MGIEKIKEREEQSQNKELREIEIKKGEYLCLRRLQHYPLGDPDNNQLLGGAQDGGGCQALASCFAHDKKNQHTTADLPHKRPPAAPQCAGKSACVL